MNIDHVGIVVRSLKAGVNHWIKVFGYEQFTEEVINTRQKVKVVFMHKEDSLTIKLIAPVGSDSPIYQFAKKGGGLHHLCFKCDEMHEELEKMKELGLRVLAAPQPGEAFENEDIAFVYGQQGLNIELIDTDKRALIIGHEED